MGGGILTGQRAMMWEEFDKSFVGFENDGGQTQAKGFNGLIIRNDLHLTISKKRTLVLKLEDIWILPTIPNDQEMNCLLKPLERNTDSPTPWF